MSVYSWCLVCVYLTIVCRRVSMFAFVSLPLLLGHCASLQLVLSLHFAYRSIQFRSRIYKGKTSHSSSSSKTSKAGIASKNSPMLTYMWPQRLWVCLKSNMGRYKNKMSENCWNPTAAVLCFLSGMWCIFPKCFHPLCWIFWVLLFIFAHAAAPFPIWFRRWMKTLLQSPTERFRLASLDKLPSR